MSGIRNTDLFQQIRQILTHEKQKGGYIMKKKIQRLYAVLTSLVMIGVFVFGTPGIPAAAAEKMTEFCIKIVHTNDIHARVEEDARSKIIGMPKLKTLIDAYTKGADLDLVLDSGDLFHGQSIATLVQGESIAKLLKACGYDAMTAGNHDWNYGKERLKELVSMADVRMLAGNVVEENGKTFFNDSYFCESVAKNGQELKVGVFGVIDPAMYGRTAPANVEKLTFQDAEAYAEKAASELEAMGCDIIIGLAHVYDPVALASKINGVDLWLTGHEHMEVDTKVSTPDGRSTYVIENGYYLYEVGLIDLDCTLDAKGDVKAVVVRTEEEDYDKAAVLEENKTVRAVLDDIKKEQSAVSGRVVGKAPEALDGDWYSLRIGETNLGRAVTDAYLLETGADVAFENAGGIRSSVSAGAVTYADVVGISPFGNYIVTRKVTGAQLRSILETSLDIQVENIVANASGEYDAWPESNGSYLQTGGITVEYNPALESGHRVISVQVGDETLEDQRLYTVAVNNYLVTSEYYPELSSAEEAGEYSACEEALIKYFSQPEEVISKSIAVSRMHKTEKTKPEENRREKPGAIKILSAKNIKPAFIRIKFSKATGAKKYEIRYAANAQFKNAGTKMTKKQTCTLKQLKTGKTYFIKARGINADGKGKWTKVKRVTVEK